MRLWLKKLRGERSQAEIAKLLGITQQYYSYIEMGTKQKKMDIQICERIAQVFDISVAEVIQYETAESSS